MKNLITKEEKDRIDSICTQYSIMKYSINPDGSIDVDGYVRIVNVDLVEFPIKFNKVSGDFYCYMNNLTSLEGGPITVGGDFSCYYNEITSLEGAPHTVVGDLICSRNKLTSTYSGDIDIELVGDVELSNNELPQLLQDNIIHIKLILKYQRHFMIWNDDLTLNVDNFKDLILEIEEGLE